ncbi:hypothetical protein CQW23_19008 [Capsicum baccatum]|uniref:Kinetochore protein Nuf2 N-terminal domain-containing protein n=1 Tax=Capsicum baccatum TaxID=33114 RepID=A0A2G2W4L4_CAPBA|nr:hypothetical protein CQW23_19008 [Capsicum baccatum]
MSRFDYPTLPQQDITDTLANFQIASISNEDLLKPTADSVTNLYSSILRHIGTLQDDHDQIREMLATLDCPEIFTLRDLIKPEPNRTRFFVGAILNFYLHREFKLNAIRPVTEYLTLIGEQRSSLEARISQLNEEITVLFFNVFGYKNL